MEDRMNARLAELRRELGHGEQLLAELTGREAELRSSMLRISGAIQVLDELLAEDAPGEGTTPQDAEANAHDIPSSPAGSVATPRVPVG